MLSIPLLRQIWHGAPKASSIFQKQFYCETYLFYCFIFYFLPCQDWGRGFESHRPLQFFPKYESKDILRA